jgi:hypothetical protein
VTDVNLSTNPGANLAALSGAIPASLFGAFMPPVTELWKAKPGSETAAQVHHAELLAGSTALIVAVTVSAMTRSTVPVFVTTVVTACIIGSYEYILRRQL